MEINPQHLAVAQQLSQFSFEIPQDPSKIRSCYHPDAIIVSNGKTLSLDEFLEYLIESNTLNVTSIYNLETVYTGFGDKIFWDVEVKQKRKGLGLEETEEGIYQIRQMAILTFENNKIIRQENTWTKTKVPE